MSTIYLIKELAEETTNFLKDFSIQNVVNCDDNVGRKLKNKHLRVCRFCNKNIADVKFENDSHLIPKSLGITKLLSDFECDSCNNKFSLWESDLSSFLGISRTIAPIANRKTPGFKSSAITAKEIKLSTGKSLTFIVNKDADNTAIKLDVNNGKAVANYFKPSYTPLNIYKLFLKIGLSCLQENDMNLYQPLLSVLNRGGDAILKNFSNKVYYYELSIKLHSPVVFVLKRSNPNSKNLMHHIQIYFGEFVYMFPIPLNILDFNSVWYQQNRVEITYCPPMFLKEIQEVNCYRDFIDLSNAERVKHKETLNINTSPKNLKNAVSWGQINGIEKKYDMNGKEIHGILLFEKGQKLTENELAEVQNIFKEIKSSR